MKMAIVHDTFTHIGGAEKVLYELISLYPDADLFIPIIAHNYKNELKTRTKGQIYSTVLSEIPFFYNKTSLLKPIIALYFEKLNLKTYNIVISSSHSFNSKLVSVDKNAKHISYVYTPPRYLLNTFNEMHFIKKFPFNFLLRPLLDWLSKKDLESGKKPFIMLACSKNTQKRIQSRYKRKSLVIYPPIQLTRNIKKSNASEKGMQSRSYYLCFSRLVKQKSIDLAIKACNTLKRELVIVGTGNELDNLKKIAGPTISFLGFLDQIELEKVFKKTKALINCAIDEDFGMVTVEAASRGIPVIGYNSGGLQETVIHGKTGILFNEYNEKSLIKAIKQFEKSNIQSIECHNFAKKFSTDVFRKKIQTIINYAAQQIE